MGHQTDRLNAIAEIELSEEPLTFSEAREIAFAQFRFEPDGSLQNGRENPPTQGDGQGTSDHDPRSFRGAGLTMSGACPPRLTVATIAREPLPVLERFVGWHLSQGGRADHPVPRRPVDPGAGGACGDPRVELRCCHRGLLGVDRAVAGARFTRRQRCGDDVALSRGVGRLGSDPRCATNIVWIPGPQPLPRALATLAAGTAARASRWFSASRSVCPNGGEAFRPADRPSPR